ncbi:MAG: hypothetical protein AB1428_06320 [Bacteroidota bacterium]
MRTPLTGVFILTLLLPPLAAPQGKISGYMFGDYFYNVSRDSSISKLPNVGATNGGKSFQAFQLRRIYFGYDNDISEQFSARFRLEGDFTAVEGSAAAQKIFIKDAFLRWKNIFAGSDLYFGVQPPPAFDISESAWGYRSLEKTIMDLRGIISSRDFGVSLRGKFDESGTVGYWVMVANNSSTNAENDKYKRYYALIHLRPSKNIQVTIHGDYKDQARINNPKSTAIPPATLSNGVLTGSVFLAYSEPEVFLIGAEGFLQSTAHGFTDPKTLDLVSRQGLGISIFGWYNVSTTLALVGRYDYYDPNSNSVVKGDVRNYILGGLSWKPDKNVSVIPNVQVETYEAQPNAGRSFDASVTARLTVYYIFL